LMRRPLPLRLLLSGLLAGLLAGCGSLLPAVERPHSAARVAAPDTPLAAVARDAGIPAEKSGVYPLPQAAFALDARLALIANARVSLDLQYYVIADDGIGHMILRGLRDAAQRGVRVRLLIDDLHTTGMDTLLLGLAAHPNVELRLFNPFTASRQSALSRALGLLADFGRLNHRMHNKLFIADGAMAVIGGRNVANEYYLRSMSENFVDVDAFTTGWVVPPLQYLFDRYWNSDPVFPLEAVARTDLSPAELRARFEDWTGPVNTPPPAELPPNDILGYGPIADDLDLGRLGLIWGEAYVFADHPDKPFDGEVGGELQDSSVTYNVFEAIRVAQQEVVASSPYFVPGPTSMEMLRELRSRGVKVTVMTNSLASTDEPIVHIGYSHYREELLRMGVDLYELSSSRLRENKRMFLFGKSLGRLHAKLVVIDKKRLFIGSMNLDPRSATINTELGAMIDSPPLARELLRIIDIDRLQSAYRVRLGPNGKGLEWLSNDGEHEMVLHEEPDSTPWLRIKSWLLTPFVPVEQL